MVKFKYNINKEKIKKIYTLDSNRYEVLEFNLVGFDRDGFGVFIHNFGKITKSIEPFVLEKLCEYGTYNEFHLNEKKALEILLRLLKVKIRHTRGDLEDAED